MAKSEKDRSRKASREAPEEDARRDAPPSSEDDTEGHGLLLDTDFYIQRKLGRDAEIEREMRERRQLKEARVNKPERR